MRQAQLVKNMRQTFVKNMRHTTLSKTVSTVCLPAAAPQPQISIDISIDLSS
jgi:hypothetical protein